MTCILANVSDVVAPLNIRISQGSAATDLRWSDIFYFSFFPQFICKCNSAKKLLELAHICQSCHKNKICMFLRTIV